jgi:hypothetical protein
MLGVVHKIGEPCHSPFNAGFLTHLYLIRTDDVVYTLSPYGSSVNQLSNAIGIQTGAIITELLIKPKTATFNETESENSDGVAYVSSLSVPMKGTARDITSWVHQNMKKRYVILTRDTMGNCYMMGSADNGARVSWSRQLTSQSMHQLSFTLVNWHPIQFLPTIKLELIFSGREFDSSFDLSFS